MTDLRADCGRCFALCCVVPAFARSADFAIDKPARTPCVNLRDDFRCGIHARLRDSGFPGCTVYDCFGAGQHVAQGTFEGRDWRGHPEVAGSMFAAFPVMRDLHELLWYIEAALARAEAHPTHDDLAAARRETERLTELDAAALTALDVNAHRAKVNQLLIQASEHVRAAATRADTARRAADTASPAATEPTGERQARGKRTRGKRTRGEPTRGESTRGESTRREPTPESEQPRKNLYGTDLRGKDLHGTNLPRKGPRGKDLRGTDLPRKDLRGKELRGKELRGKNLPGKDLPRKDLRGKDLRGTDLPRKDPRGRDLRGKDLRGADLMGRDLTNADLRGANLRGAYLIGADLTSADLRGADVIGADLRGAHLAEANLADTLYLTQFQVNAAHGDATTTLPATLERPPHWAT